MQIAPSYDGADILLCGKPYTFTLAFEFHICRHHARCQGEDRADMQPTGGRSWEQLGDDLAVRFPPHLWHPCHWDAYEQAQIAQWELRQRLPDSMDGTVVLCRRLRYNCPSVALRRA